MFKSSFWLFFIWNWKYEVLLKFRSSKFFLNHSLTLAKIIFNLLANYIGLGLVIIRLVSSEYNNKIAIKNNTEGKTLKKYKKKIEFQELTLAVLHA
jgi:hypothetical protein